MLWIATLLAVGSAAARGQTSAADARELGRQYTEWFYSGETARLWGRLSPEMKKLFGTAEGLAGFRTQVEAQAGTETAVLSEEVQERDGLRAYLRLARFSKAPGPVAVQWVVAADGTVTGFAVRPQPQEAASQHLDYRTKTPLRLPFQGEWFVFWGGRTVAENYHAATRDQRFAYDFVIVRDGKSHTGDGSANEQYFCFGQPILAPGPGTVAVAVDGVADNKPGVMNPAQPPGNHVVIDHGNGEFSFLAHFKQKSLEVKKGDAVKAGDLLGRCGNSGNSSEPHLHYHLQTTAEFREGEGLPAQFQGYVADGEKVERGEPRKGQTIRPQPK
ncbi:MAG TPA: M23 family metallopeptidase [Thermoanaerobaculia bacterium]|nr:M23 family metallopeptidase [Thermoanaerobaculia bacterium]